MVRAPAVDKNGLKKGAWSQEEDAKLRAYIQRYGHWNWRQLPKFAGLSRCGKSCRLRWMNYLRPDVKRGNFSEEEDALIIQMHKELGNKWSRIAMKLPGRTDNEIKNHWHTNLNKPAKRHQSASETSTQSDQASRQTFENSESVSVNTPSSESDLLHPKINVDQYCPSSQEVLSCSTVSLSNGSMSASGSEDSLSSMDIMFQDLNADFLTLPFLADNYVDNDPLFLSEGECVSSPLYASNNYDDSIDWIQQVMKELEDN